MNCLFVARMAGSTPRALRARFALLAGAIALLAPALALADVSTGYRSLYADRKAYAIGDTVQILVVESTQAQSAAGTGANSATELSLAARADNSAAAGALALAGEAGGNGQTSRSGSVRTVVTAQVSDITAEGNLVLDANQEVVINDEQQRIRIHGVARRLDITADNYVPSNRLAQASIRIEGSGSVSGAQRPGFLFRFFKWMRLL
jgi:flagellar L-ring protein precursor FlgH